MTDRKSAIAEKDHVSEKSKEINPYKLPGDGQLLAYLHYKKNTALPTKPRFVSHKYLEEKADATKPDSNAVLIKVLRSGGKSIGTTFSKSRYIQDVRQLSRWKLILGQKHDACIQFDQQLDIEKKKFHEIKQQYKECANALERFLAHEYAVSMAMLEAAEIEYKRTYELSERRDHLSRLYGQTRLEVYHWEETWRSVRACHRFLIRVSPLKGHEDDSEVENEDEDYENSEFLESSVKDMAASNKTATDIDHDSSLQLIIATFEQEINTLPKSPAKTPSDLGLVEASDLLQIFRTIESQNLNALIHLESLGGPMADMRARIDVAEGHVKREIDDVLEDISRLEASIVREERRAQCLERRCAQLVQQGFRSLICSEDALRVKVLVEDAYEACVAQNEAGLDPLLMTRGLENAYEHLSAQLDLLPQHLVTACEREGFLRELRESREAEDAARKFELMHRLLAALRRMMEPLEPKRRPLMYRSLPKRKARRKKLRRITVADKTVSARDTHLDFFAKVCKAKKNSEDKDTDDFNANEENKSANVESARI